MKHSTIMRFRKLICASLWTTLLLVSSFVSAHAQEGIQGQLLEHGDKSPIVGAAIVLTPGGTQDTLRSLTDEQGVFTLPRALTYPLRLRASYFGESILDTLLTNPPSPPSYSMPRGSTTSEEWSCLPLVGS